MMAMVDESVNDRFVMSAALAALLRFGAALHIDRRKRGEHVTSSSLLYALHKVGSDQAPLLLIDDPAASAFCAALRDSGEANASAMAEAWQDYDTSLISIGVTLLPPMPRLSANISRLLDEAAARAAAEQAPAIGTAHLIDAILAQPTSRMKRRLDRAKVDLITLGARYRAILAGLRPQPANIIDTGRHPLVSGTPPDWASGWGQDEFGVFAEITVENVTQRLRWIPPGRFLMGSPEDEERRWDDEGPQAEISFAHGYWLFDTAVTHALWRAVMGDSPSRFKGDDLPVEQVSFDDAGNFIERLSALVPGLDLHLPSEAQWEYACRAGTTTRYTFGDEALPDQIHFNAKSTIAVTAKPPNGWGLYQMHGNAYEWCADIWHDSHEGADAKGAPRQSDSQPGGQGRVVRGGSWSNDARSVRAAYRRGLDPGFAFNFLGFRCAAGQLGPEAPAAEPQRGRGAASSYPSREAAQIIGHGRVSAEKPQSALVLPIAPFIIRTDRADLEVARITRADLGWARGLGRDRFGLWADLTVDAVTQRLRWIPPGQFLMGSPEDEPGRYDDEGPQTEVTIGQGYWLFDTPVTQGLWQAVMGRNPSRFVSAERPVERVSWKDADRFIGTMNDRFKGLGLHLPGEAQWEYACRAGTSDATYAGPIEIMGAHNAPVLDAIAWYGGNSGVDFDPADGYNSKNWPEKQYAHDKAGTREVKLKRANAYGLYDMLGNVWEWCADIWRDSHADADPSGVPRQSDSQSGGQPRVVRGGSWNGVARNARAACRNGGVPDVAFNDLGFRCAAGQ